MLRNGLLFVCFFSLIKLGADVYQAFYHGIGLHWSSAVFGLAMFAVAATGGHLLGLIALRRPIRHRAVPFVAAISYFVSVSLAHLLANVVTTLPVFLAGMCAVTFTVTVWIGPRWD